MKKLLFVVLLFSSAPLWSADDLKPLSMLAPLKRPLMVGATSWGRDDYFRLKWKYDAEGLFIWADRDPIGREIWVASQAEPGKITMTALDEHGEILRRFSLSADFKEFQILRAKGGEPTFVGRNDFQLIAFDAAGGRQEFKTPKASPADLAVIPKSMGGPMVVAGYNYGEAGLRAFRPDGKLLWEQADIERAYNVRLDEVDGKPVLTSSDGVGKITLVDLRGRVLERIHAGGNTDRVMFDSSKQDGWMFGLDSGADSWKESFSVWHAAPGKRPGKHRWNPVSAADLGALSVISYALGDFDGTGALPIVGTDNGWVLLLDRAGRVLSEARFRGSVVGLGPVDMDGDGRDELVVSVSGYSGNVFVFTRGGR